LLVPRDAKVLAAVLVAKDKYNVGFLCIGHHMLLSWSLWDAASDLIVSPSPTPCRPWV